MIQKTLHIGLDLGGDTLKIAFAYRDDENIRYGKMVGENDLLQIAVPALAYYDISEGKWFFADEIDKRSPEEYITVVKIKSLIAMLSQPTPPTEDDLKLKYAPKAADKAKLLQKLWQARLAIWRSNKKYYAEGEMFPKFYFPVKREALQNFAKMVELDMTFQAPGTTPRDVCSEFFAYVHKLVQRGKTALERKLGHTFQFTRLALVHPAKVGEDYLKELSDLIYEKFGQRPTKVLNTNKALALLAKHRNAAVEGDKFLVFDMGEESVSVVQAAIKNGEVSIDGVEGHSRPCAIGGNDIDEAIVHFLENRVNNRETFGTPSAGEEGHIREGSAYGKQYMLMKEVKKAKVIFSQMHGENDLFADGVPVTLRREVFVQCHLTQEDVKRSIGILGDTGIARQLAAYIADEVKRPINRGVKKVFVSGGTVETFALIDYITAYLQNVGSRVSVHTYDDNLVTGDDFSILSYEDSVFAPAVGGAIVSLLNIDVKTVFSLSYASWVNGIQGSAAKHLAIFANRGEEISAKGTEKYSDSFGVLGRGVSGEEMYSVLWTEQDMAEQFAARAKNSYTFSPDGRLDIGEINSPARRLAEKEDGVGLKLVSGGSGGKIRLWYNGQYVVLTSSLRLWIQEGISLDKYGNATPVVRNCTDRNTGYGEVFLVGNNPEATAGIRQRVRLADIEPRFVGLSDFVTSIS